MRLEHWTNATEQGVHAARRLLAGDDAGEPFAPVPFVWSDQYDRKIQTRRASCRPTPTLHVAHGSFAERQFVALFGRGGRVVGALGFNRPRQVMQYRRLIAERALVGRRARAARPSAMTDAPSRAPERLVTPRFALVVSSGLLLLHRARDAHAGAAAVRREVARRTARVAVGIAVGAFAVGAIVLRAYAGRLGDSLGRRVLDHRRRAHRRASRSRVTGSSHALWYLVADAGRRPASARPASSSARRR